MVSRLLELREVQWYAACSPCSILLRPTNEFSRLGQLAVRLKAPSCIFDFDISVSTWGDIVSQRASNVVRASAVGQRVGFRIQPRSSGLLRCRLWREW